MRYILNSAVITSPGTYRYRLLSVEEAKDWLDRGGFYSTIGYEETADAFERIFGVRPEVRRELIKMNPGDEALVFRLTKRLGDVSKKGHIGMEEVLANLEIGLLERIE